MLVLLSGTFNLQNTFNKDFQQVSFLLKRDSETEVFLQILQHFSEETFYKTPVKKFPSLSFLPEPLIFKKQ